MLKGKLDLLSNTNMVDFAMDVYQNLYPDQEVPQSMIVDILICCCVVLDSHRRSDQLNRPDRPNSPTKLDQARPAA